MKPKSALNTNRNQSHSRERLSVVNLTERCTRKISAINKRLMRNGVDVKTTTPPTVQYLEEEQ